MSLGYASLATFVTSMGTSLYPSDSAGTVQSREVSANASILCQWNGKDAYFWTVEGLPTLLHIFLFLFFGGLLIFLFNTDHEVFTFCGLVDRALLDRVWIGHTITIDSAR